MFLHAGASLHGHEYSNTPPHPNRAPKRSPFMRCTFRSLSDSEANVGYLTPPHHSPNPTSASSPSPSPPRRRSLSRDYHPDSYAAVPSLPSPGSQTAPARPRPKSDYLSRRDHNVRFAEPEVSLDEGPARSSLPGRYSLQSSPTERNWVGHSEDESAFSEASDANTSTSCGSRKRRRRTTRSGTRYLVAQPPSHGIKRPRRFIHLRPALFLQLQELTDTRPKPVVDVIPSSILRGALTSRPRIAGRFAKPLWLRHELGSDDLVLAQSEDYDSSASDDGADGGLGKREILAVLSPRSGTSGGCTDIMLPDGSVWMATATSNGSYEFAAIRADGSTVTARWVRRRAAREEMDDYKYTFSVLDPSSRRHPIMGTLTPMTLEVLDNYTTVSSHSSGRPPPSRSFTPDSGAERSTLPVDEETRALIAASGVWISLVRLGIATEPRGGLVAHTPHHHHVQGVAASRSLEPAVDLAQFGQAGPGDMTRASHPRKWGVSVRRSDTGSSGPPGAEEGLGMNGSAGGGEGHGNVKKKIYGRIKKVFKLGRDEER